MVGAALARYADLFYLTLKLIVSYFLEEVGY